jgi:hypothetical protein
MSSSGTNQLNQLPFFLGFFSLIGFGDFVVTISGDVSVSELMTIT